MVSSANSAVGQNKLSQTNRILALMYWLIVASFSILEPWGNIDTRDFSYMGTYKFWEYNIYIVFVLGAMLVLSVMLWRNRVGIKTIAWIAVINTMFIIMNLFDALHFFPDPAQPMPILVTVIETVTSVLAFGILLFVVKDEDKNGASSG